jgi:hypothetical protein
MQPEGGHLCARARFWLSLRVDGELSELESELLDVHVGRCTDCAEFASCVTVSTAWLREAPLERPSPVTIAPSKAPWRAAAGLTASAAVLTLALVAGAVHGIGSTHGRRAALSPTVSLVSNSDPFDELRLLRRTSLLNERPLPREFSLEPS